MVRKNSNPSLNKIVVTGSTGFVGTNLVSNLLSQNFKVIGISKKKQKSLKNFLPIKKNISNIQNSHIKHNFSKIIHTAALTDVKFCENNPSQCYKTNVTGTENILEIARKKNASVIFLSTNHVYGNPKTLPVKEDSSLTPQSIYSSSKKLCETLCETYSKLYGLDITVLRLFSVFGPNSPPANLIFKIVHDIIHENKIKIGNLKPKRDFIFINDVIDAIKLIINSQKKGFHVYNIGSGKSLSVKELCKTVLQISNKNMPIISEKSRFRKNDILDVISNNSKMKFDFNWIPQTTLYDGLRLTYDYYLNKH